MQPSILLKQIIDGTTYYVKESGALTPVQAEALRFTPTGALSYLESTGTHYLVETDWKEHGAITTREHSSGILPDVNASRSALGKKSPAQFPKIENLRNSHALAEYPLPIIHSNGTGIKMLTEGYDDARAKLRAARTAFDQIEFNGRDYYTHPDAGAFQSARAAREDVAAKFEEIAAYLDAHLEHLEDPRAEAAERQHTVNGDTAAPRRR